MQRVQQTDPPSIITLAIVELKTIAVFLPRERNYAKKLMMITSASHTTNATDA